MNVASLNKTSIPISWSFYDHSSEYPSIEQLQKASVHINEQVISDVRSVLKILEKEGLLIPDNVVFDKEYEILAVSVDDFCDQLWEIVRQKPEMLSIDRIGGRGVVLLPDGTKEETRDLVMLEDIRFCDYRQLQVKTFSSVWIPVSMSDHKSHTWQPELADANAPRLTRALKKMAVDLGMEAEPAENEIDRENSIWIKGFELYASSEALSDISRENAQIQAVELQRFLLKV